MDRSKKRKEEEEESLNRKHFVTKSTKPTDGRWDATAKLPEAPNTTDRTRLRQGHVARHPFPPPHHRRPPCLTLPWDQEEVRKRVAQWDQLVSDYIELAERYLGFQLPNSLYKFADTGDGQRRLSWTFEKGGIKLEWRWKCQPSPDSKKTAEVLDFLMDANIKLSEEVVSKTISFESLKAEAEKCLAQSERFSREKAEFKDAIYAKFLGVLNAKKAKLWELRDKLSKHDVAEKPGEEYDESTQELDEDTSVKGGFME